MHLQVKKKRKRKKKALCNEKKFGLYWLEKRLHRVQVFIGKNIQPIREGQYQSP